jgi:Ni/Co efflux regulator RcnB
MERRFFLLAAPALLLPGTALAQPRDRDRPGRDDHRGPDRGPGRDDHRPGPGPGMRPPPRPQFSWRGRNFDRYRGPAFRYPAGFGYRRWAVGAVLPGLFLSSTYYWNDWRGLGVGAPPPGRRWVRYGPDLVLVNVRSRRIEDVVTDVFY